MTRSRAPHRSRKDATHQLGMYRGRMDALNAKLLALLTKRTAIALRIAGVKRAAGMPLRAPAREKQVLQQVRRAARGALPPAAAARIFRAIIAETLATETRAARRRSPPSVVGSTAVKQASAPQPQIRPRPLQSRVGSAQ